MALEVSKTVAADYEAVTAQLASLREEMAKLATSVGKATVRQSQSIMDDVTDGMNEAARYVGKKGQTAEAQFETAVASNPWAAIAIAAGMGVLIGAMTRR